MTLSFFSEKNGSSLLKMSFNIEYSCQTLDKHCCSYMSPCPNFSPPIKCHISARRGRLCNSGVVPTGHLRTLCHNSFRSKAATIFNCLPKHIRDLVNCANTSIFKRALDYHLCSIEDSPMVPNECNSLTSRSKENAINKKWRAAIADQAE